MFDRFHAKLAPALAKLGIRETAGAARARDRAGLATCGGFADAARTCLLAAEAAPVAWATCKVEPPFALYDGAAARESLLGPPIADSPARIAALAGTWQLARQGNNDGITWRISKDGKLAARRIPKTGKPIDEPPRELVFVREHLLAVKTGAATQFIPAFVDGDRLYMSWTSGAHAHPIADRKSFVLDLAGGDRFIVWAEPACTRVDPKRGASPATCAWHGDAFVVDDTPWPYHGGALVHPATEIFERQGGK